MEVSCKLAPELPRWVIQVLFPNLKSAPAVEDGGRGPLDMEGDESAGFVAARNVL
jgi:hypothetical protein